MNPAAWLRAFRRPTFKSWVGAALVGLLLLAESFAVTHPLDSAAHSNGQQCAACLSISHLGHGTVSVSVPIVFVAATPAFVASVVAVFVSIVPARRYARGPPRVSFAL